MWLVNRNTYFSYLQKQVAKTDFITRFNKKVRFCIASFRNNRFNSRNLTLQQRKMLERWYRILCNREKNVFYNLELY